MDPRNLPGSRTVRGGRNWNRGPEVLISLLHFVGDRVLATLYRLGEAARLMGRVVAEMPFVWRVRGETVTQMIRIGVDSLPLVAVKTL